jgi:diguanylate cyclase
MIDSVHGRRSGADQSAVTATQETAGKVPRWRLTPTLVVAAVVLAIAWAVFSVGLARPIPALLGWLPLAVALPNAVRTSWRAGAAGRTFWRYISVGMAVLGCGLVSNARDYYSGREHGQHLSMVTSAIYVAGLFTMLAGLLRIRGVRRSRKEWARFGLDIATVIVTVLTFAWHLMRPRWQTWAAVDSGDMWAIVTVVSGGFLCVFAFVKVAFTGTGLIDRRAMHLLAVTGAVGATGGAAAPLVASRPYLNAAFAVIPAASLLLCFAADRQLRVLRVDRPIARPQPRHWSAMPYAAVLATGALLLVSITRHTPDILAVGVGAVLVTLLVAARQIVALNDNAALLDDLDLRQQQLHHQATHDALTGLVNRSVLVREIARTLAAGRPRAAVALIDLDNFKSINDDLGHAAGDALLTAVAVRLRESAAEGDVVARLGGDEYALLLHGDHDATLAAITDQLRRPVQAAGHDLVVEASIGLAIAGAGDQADELLRRADVAMYEAKSQGKGRHVTYQPAMDQHSAEQARLAADLRIALDSGGLELHYQPIVSIPDGSMFGVEALARWTHPEHGPISPAAFIPAAERTGLIVPLGAWILEQACRQAVAWADELGDDAPQTVTVNVSARQLREAGFAADLSAVLQRTGMPARLLTVEVTETAVFDGGAALTTLHAISALGVNIALDDFGTGHSSLSLLRTCPADILKVDKSFVDTVTDGGEHTVVAAALIQISDGLHLRAVAEGVETAEQARALHRLGYRYAQGYHYARPMPAAGIADYQRRRQGALTVSP